MGNWRDLPGALREIGTAEIDPSFGLTLGGPGSDEHDLGVHQQSFASAHTVTNHAPWESSCIPPLLLHANSAGRLVTARLACSHRPNRPGSCRLRVTHISPASASPHGLVRWEVNPQPFSHCVHVPCVFGCFLIL